MLLKELGNLKMEQKEKVGDFNKRFDRIFNRFPPNKKPHYSIKIDYFTSALPSSIAQFVKRTAKPTLDETFEEVIIVEKDLCAIGAIANDEVTKDSKYMRKR